MWGNGVMCRISLMQPFLLTNFAFISSLDIAVGLLWNVNVFYSLTQLKWWQNCIHLHKCIPVVQFVTLNIWGFTLYLLHGYFGHVNCILDGIVQIKMPGSLVFIQEICAVKVTWVVSHFGTKFRFTKWNTQASHTWGSLYMVTKILQFS